MREEEHARRVASRYLAREQRTLFTSQGVSSNKITNDLRGGGKPNVAEFVNSSSLYLYPILFLLRVQRFVVSVSIQHIFLFFLLSQ